MKYTSISTVLHIVIHIVWILWKLVDRVSGNEFSMCKRKKSKKIEKTRKYNKNLDSE